MWTVNKDNVLHLRIQNTSERETIVFEGADSFEGLVRHRYVPLEPGSALALVWCDWLSWRSWASCVRLSCRSVACMGVFIVLFIASSTSFLDEAIAWFSPKPLETGPIVAFKTAFMYSVQALLWLVPISPAMTRRHRGRRPASCL